MDRARTVTGTRVVVVSPSCVYGPGGKTLTEMPAQLLNAGHFAWIEDGRGLTNYVYVKNLVDGFIAAAVTPHAHGERFIVSDGWIRARVLRRAVRRSPPPVCPSSPPERNFAPAEEARGPRSKTLAGPWFAIPSYGGSSVKIGGSPDRRRSSRTHPGRLQPRQGGAAQRRRELERQPHIGRVRPRCWRRRTSRFCSVQRRRCCPRRRHARRLQWKPRVDLQAGQAASRAWLREIGLWPEDAAR